MIKKYKEFSESSEEKFILSIKDTDLDADYEFHNMVSPMMPSELFPGNHKSIVKKAYEYFRKIFIENNLNCEKFWFGYKSGEKYYFVDFYGNKSDLEKINEYYGILRDKNIIRSPIDFDRSFLLRSWSSIHDNGNDDEALRRYIPRNYPRNII